MALGKPPNFCWRGFLVIFRKILYRIETACGSILFYRVMRARAGVTYYMVTSYLEEAGGPPLESSKDEDILKASQGEPALFQMIVERYQEPLMRAALRVVRSREEAEDIVQEAFVKMYKNADKFQKYEGIEFKSWAYKVTINTAITHYRKLKKGEVLVEDPALFEVPSGEHHELVFAAAADAKVVVAKVLEKMPPHLRVVMHRFYFEDKSYQDIAREEGISIPTLKMRLFRAKRLFKKLSEDI